MRRTSQVSPACPRLGRSSQRGHDRHQRQRQHERGRHRRDHRRGQRPVHASLDAGHPEEGNEHGDDDQRREGDRPPDLDRGGERPRPCARRRRRRAERWRTFSVTMIAASTSSPTAIARPPSVMVLMPTPAWRRKSPARPTESGMVQRDDERRAHVAEQREQDERRRRRRRAAPRGRRRRAPCRRAPTGRRRCAA